MNLYCNPQLRECRVLDGEVCTDSTQCNPTATCEVGVCDNNSLCYQTASGPCLDGCDCADKYFYYSSFLFYIFCAVRNND